MTNKVPKTKTKKPRPGRAWGVVVRLANGCISYLFYRDSIRDWQGKLVELWGRESQALRFESKEEAEAVAARMRTNSTAKEYKAVPLPWKRD